MGEVIQGPAGHADRAFFVTHGTMGHQSVLINGDPWYTWVMSHESASSSGQVRVHTGFSGS